MVVNSIAELSSGSVHDLDTMGLSSQELSVADLVLLRCVVGKLNVRIEMAN